jgi:hypothetical protein
MSKQEEYETYVTMLKLSYISIGSCDNSDLCKQIRKIYKIFSNNYKNNILYDNHKKYVKQYLKIIKTWEYSNIIEYGKQVIKILE